MTIWKTNVADLSPLRDLPKFKRVRISLNHSPEALRNHPTLQFIAYDELGPYVPAAEFFARRAPFDKSLAQIRAALPSLGLDPTQVLVTVGAYGTILKIEGLPFADARPLRALPIDELSLHRSKVTDLSPLRGMRLKQLSFDDTPIPDVSPLLDMPILEAAMVPRAATNLEVLRRHPTLKWLGWEQDWDGNASRPALTTADFWARFDAEREGKR